MNKIYKIAPLVIIIKAIILYSCTPEIQEFIDPVPIPTQGAKITTNGFAATWKPLLGAKSYIIEVATDGSFDEEFLIEETPTEVEDTFFIVKNVEVAHTYYYRLLARLSTGEQTRYSDIITVKTLGMPSPLALDASQVGPTQFTAVWQKVDEAKTYEIEVASDIKFANTASIQRLITEDTSVTIKENLQVDQDYFYRVLAKKGDIISDYSNTVHLTTTQLIKPTISEVSDVTQTGFTASWEPVTGAVNYTVEVTTDPLFLDVQAFSVQDAIVSETQYSAIDLDANTTYYYRVRANNERSFSEYSEEGIVTTLSLDAPTALPGSEIGRNSFRASWQEMPTVESYRLEVATDAYFTQPVSGYDKLVLDDTTILVTGLKQNTNYYYRVSTLGFNAASTPSNAVQVTTSVLPAPVLYEATSVSSNSFTAAWSSVVDVESYALEVSTNPNFSTIATTIPDITDTLYEVQGLTVGMMYYYRVRAQEGINYSLYSNIANQQLIESPTSPSLSIPTNLTTSNINYTGFIISWDMISDATYYTVDIATDSQFLSMVAGYEEVVANGTSLVVGGLEDNTTYFARVKAHDDELSSDYSEIASARTDAVDPPVAQQPITSNAYDIYASWSLIEDASHYLLDVAMDAGFATMLPGYENVSVEATYSLIGSLQPSTTYYYRVRSVVEGNPSSYSNAILVTTDDIPVQTASGTIEVENYSQSDGVERVYSATASGDYYLGSIHQGNSVTYEVDVPSTGDYSIEFRVSNNNADSKQIAIIEDGSFKRSVSVPPTGGWENWQTVSVIVPGLTSGNSNIQLLFTGGISDEELLRIDWINIQPE